MHDFLQGLEHVWVMRSADFSIEIQNELDQYLPTGSVMHDAHKLYTPDVAVFMEKQ
jgi:hypothetical protein